MKETIVKILKRIAHIFNGTKQCHAKLDEAVKRAESLSARAAEVCERRHLVTNGNGAHS
jgi:hypothetical protein